MGESRSAALKRLSERVQSDDMRNFVQTLVQSEGVGISRATILRNQANDLRHRRMLAAEERAQKAPVKMLFPIAIFILPVMFIVILGPAIKQASELFSS
jgi:tight adherence protein C